jgi:hypothetical protein
MFYGFSVPVGENLREDFSHSVRGSQCSTAGFCRKHLTWLDQFKFEFDRAFGRVKEEWQALDLGLKPISGPQVSKPFKTRKFLKRAARVLRRKNRVRPKPKPLPKPSPGCGSKPGSGRVVASPSNPCIAASFSSPEMVMVPVSTGFLNDRHARTSPVTTGLLPVCSDDDGSSLSRPVGVPEAPSAQVMTAILPVCSDDDGDSLSRPVGVPEAPSAQVFGFSDAGDLPSCLPFDQNTLVDAGAAQSSSPAVGLTAASVAGSATLQADLVLGGCLIPSPEETEPTAKNSLFRYEGSASLADDDFAVRCNLSAVVIAHKPSKPLYFYNRKHKVQRASKLDLGQLAGELIYVAPGAVPLVGSQCSVSGESSGLFAAFEPVGLAGSKVEDPFRRSPFPATILDVGDSSESDLLDGYSEVVVSSLEIAQALGISFGGHKKRFLDLMSVIEKGQHRVNGGSVSKPKGWRELKNLECSLNFDVGGIGSNRGKNRASLRV